MTKKPIPFPYDPTKKYPSSRISFGWELVDERIQPEGSVFMRLSKGHVEFADIDGKLIGTTHKGWDEQTFRPTTLTSLIESPVKIIGEIELSILKLEKELRALGVSYYPFVIGWDYFKISVAQEWEDKIDASHFAKAKKISESIAFHYRKAKGF